MKSTATLSQIQQVNNILANKRELSDSESDSCSIRNTFTPPHGTYNKNIILNLPNGRKLMRNSTYRTTRFFRTTFGAFILVQISKDRSWFDLQNFNVL